MFPARHKAKTAAAKSASGPLTFGQQQQHASGSGSNSGGGQFRGGNLSSIPKPGFQQQHHQHQQVNDDGTMRPFHKVENNERKEENDKRSVLFPYPCANTYFRTTPIWQTFHAIVCVHFFVHVCFQFSRQGRVVNTFFHTVGMCCFLAHDFFTISVCRTHFCLQHFTHCMCRFLLLQKPPRRRRRRRSSSSSSFVVVVVVVVVRRRRRSSFVVRRRSSSFVVVRRRSSSSSSFVVVRRSSSFVVRRRSSSFVVVVRRLHSHSGAAAGRAARLRQDDAGAHCGRALRVPRAGNQRKVFWAAAERSSGRYKSTTTRRSAMILFFPFLLFLHSFF